MLNCSNRLTLEFCFRLTDKVNVSDVHPLKGRSFFICNLDDILTLHRKSFFSPEFNLCIKHRKIVFIFTMYFLLEP